MPRRIPALEGALINIHSTDTIFYDRHSVTHPAIIYPPLSKPAEPQLSQIITSLDPYSISELIQYGIGFIGIQVPDDITFNIYAELYVDGVSQGVKTIVLTYNKGAYNFFYYATWGDFDPQASHLVEVYYWTDEGSGAYINWERIGVYVSTISDVPKIIWQKSFDRKCLFSFQMYGDDAIWDTEHLYVDDILVDSYELMWSGSKITFKGDKNFSLDGNLIYQRIYIS